MIQINWMSKNVEKYNEQYSLYTQNNRTGKCHSNELFSNPICVLTEHILFIVIMPNVSVRSLFINFDVLSHIIFSFMLIIDEHINSHPRWLIRLIHKANHKF